MKISSVPETKYEDYLKRKGNIATYLGVKILVTKTYRVHSKSVNKPRKLLR